MDWGTSSPRYLDIFKKYTLILLGSLLFISPIFALILKNIGYYQSLILVSNIITSLILAPLIIYKGKYLFIKFQNNKRYISASLLSIPVFYNLFFNIWHIVNWSKMVTNSYKNNLWIFFSILVISVIEWARDEKILQWILKALPVNEGLKIIKKELQNNSYHEGTIVFIDMIGYTKLCDSIDERDQYYLNKSIQNYIINYFTGGDINGFGGDGIYYIWDENFSKKSFLNHLQNLIEFVNTEWKIPHLEFSKTLNRYGLFRGSITYGSYNIIDIETENRLFRHAVGRDMNHLAKIIKPEINNEKPSVRLLINKFLDSNIISKLYDTKKEFLPYPYIEIINLAAHSEKKKAS
jgi:hypothetical protein